VRVSKSRRVHVAWQ